MTPSPDIVKLSLDVPLAGAEKKPPTEFRIFPFGKVATSKGTFSFDEDDAAGLLEAFLSQGNELMIDYDHLAVDPILPGQAKAAGWFVPQIRDDGLWATDVKWTPEAARMLASSEYGYFSPAFDYDKRGHIQQLANVALTNLPATKQMRPLVAASAVAFRAAPVVDGTRDGSAAEGRLGHWAGGPEQEKVDWAK